MPVNQTEFYKIFKKDINERNPQRLPNSALVQRITTAKNQLASPEESSQARAEIFDSVSKLMTTIIERFTPSQISPEEVVGEAYETLEGCIKNFDPQSGTTFTGYFATSLINKLRGPITVIDLEQPFHIPVDRRQQGHRILKAFTPLAQELQHEPSRNEWYEATEYDPTLRGLAAQARQEDFNYMHHINVKKPYVRIGHEVGSGHIDVDRLNVRQGQIEEVLIDETSLFEDQVAFELDLPVDIANAVATAQLSSQQRLVFDAKVAGGEKIRTNDEVAAELGCTSQNVAQRWHSALRKLRRPLAQYHWELK
jgi:RNA polymerase sigma factor (sigma-70 family)